MIAAILRRISGPRPAPAPKPALTEFCPHCRQPAPDADDWCLSCLVKAL